MELNHQELKTLAQLLADELQGRFTFAGRWLTKEEAINYAKVSWNTLKKWIRQGHIYGFRRSGKGCWIIDRQSIDQFYDQERQS